MGEAELRSDGELRGSGYSPERLRWARPGADFAESGLSAAAGACAPVSA